MLFNIFLSFSYSLYLNYTLTQHITGESMIFLSKKPNISVSPQYFSNSFLFSSKLLIGRSFSPFLYSKRFIHRQTIIKKDEFTNILDKRSIFSNNDESYITKRRIFTPAGDLIIENVKFANIQSTGLTRTDAGGAIFIISRSSVSFKNVSFQNCSSYLQGGAICASNPILFELCNCIFDSCHSGTSEEGHTSSFGASFSLTNARNLTVTNSSFLNNFCEGSSSGFSVYFLNACDAIFERCQFEDRESCRFEFCASYRGESLFNASMCEFSSVGCGILHLDEVGQSCGRFKERFVFEDCCFAADLDSGMFLYSGPGLFDGVTVKNFRRCGEVIQTTSEPTTEPLAITQSPTESATESLTQSPTESPSQSPANTPAQSLADTPSQSPSITPTESQTGQQTETTESNQEDTQINTIESTQIDTQTETIENTQAIFSTESSIEFASSSRTESPIVSQSDSQPGESFLPTREVSTIVSNSILSSPVTTSDQEQLPHSDYGSSDVLDSFSSSFGEIPVNSQRRNKKTTFIIVGVVIGCIVFAAVAVLLIVYFVVLRKRELSKSEGFDFIHGDSINKARSF